MEICSVIVEPYTIMIRSGKVAYETDREVQRLQLWMVDDSGIAVKECVWFG